MMPSEVICLASPNKLQLSSANGSSKCSTKLRIGSVDDAGVCAMARELGFAANRRDRARNKRIGRVYITFLALMYVEVGGGKTHVLVLCLNPKIESGDATIFYS